MPPGQLRWQQMRQTYHNVREGVPDDLFPRNDHIAFDHIRRGYNVVRYWPGAGMRRRINASAYLQSHCDEIVEDLSQFDDDLDLFRSQELLRVEELAEAMESDKFRDRVRQMLALGRQGLTDVVNVKVTIDFHSINFKESQLDVFYQQFGMVRRVPVGGEDQVIQQLVDAVYNYEELWVNGEGSMQQYCILNMKLMKFEVYSFDPHGGGNYRELPKWLSKHRTTILNIKNVNNRQTKHPHMEKICLPLCKAAFDTDLTGVHTSKMTTVSRYLPKLPEYNVDDFPIHFNELDKYERKWNVKIYVWSLKEKFYNTEWSPVEHNESAYRIRRMSAREEDWPIMDVFLYDPDQDGGASRPGHYCLIRDIHRFMSVLSPDGEDRKHLCRRCCHSWKRADDFEAHKAQCEQRDPEAVEEKLPKKQFFTFDAHSKTMKLPIYIMFDFEAFIQGPNKDHVANSVCYNVVSRIPFELSEKDEELFNQWGVKFQYRKHEPRSKRDRREMCMVLYRGPMASTMAIRIQRRLLEACTRAKTEALKEHAELPKDIKDTALYTHDACACCGMNAENVFKFKHYQMCNGFLDVEKEHVRIRDNLYYGMRENERNFKRRKEVADMKKRVNRKEMPSRKHDPRGAQEQAILQEIEVAYEEVKYKRAPPRTFEHCLYGLDGDDENPICQVLLRRIEVYQKWQADVAHSKQELNTFFKRNYHQWKYENEMKYVVHHDHFTGDYLGPAHNYCNRLARQSEKDLTPLIAHNAMGYDVKVMLDGYNHQEDGEKGSDAISGLPGGSGESFKTIFFNSGRIVDSLAHLQGSLEKIFEKLKPQQKALTNAFRKDLIAARKNHTRNDHIEIDQLLNGKTSYPYEAANWDLMKVHPSQVTHEMFNSSLKANISKKEYKEYLRLCELMRWETFGEAHDFYLMNDVMMLSDVIESHVKFGHKTFGLDPMHYIGAPSFAIDACLRTCQYPVELVKDKEMFKCVENAKRGGYSHVMGRRAKANNPYMEEHYNPDEATSYLMQWDVNGLYTYIQNSYMPAGAPRRMKKKDIDALNRKDGDGPGVRPLSETFADLPTPLDVNDYHDLPEFVDGGWLTISGYWPKDCHDQIDLPMLGEKMSANEGMLSAYNRKALELNGKKYMPTQKLFATLEPKDHYTESIHLLMYAQSKGFVITEVHEGCTVRMKRILNPFMDKCAELRKIAKKAGDDFASDLLKLYCNSTFGKWCQAVRGMHDLKVATSDEDFRRIRNDPRFEGGVVTFGDVAFVRMKQDKVYFSRPMYMGSMILSLSKLHVFKFHYDVVKKIYGDKARLLKMDTDSLLYHVETEDIYDDMVAIPELRKWIETSNYTGPFTTLDGKQLKDSSRKKQLGLLQNESCDGEGSMFIIHEFVGLRAKCFAYRLYDWENDVYITTCKCKGIAKGKLPNKKKDAGALASIKELKQAENVFKETPTWMNELVMNVKRQNVKQYTMNEFDISTWINTQQTGEIKVAHNFVTIGSQKLKLRTLTMEAKEALAAVDDKWHVCMDGNYTLPYGHWRIEEERKKEAMFERGEDVDFIVAPLMLRTEKFPDAKDGEETTVED